MLQTSNTTSFLTEVCFSPRPPWQSTTILFHDDHRGSKSELLHEILTSVSSYWKKKMPSDTMVFLCDSTSLKFLLPYLLLFLFFCFYSFIQKLLRSIGNRSLSNRSFVKDGEAYGSGDDDEEEEEEENVLETDLLYTDDHRFSETEDDLVADVTHGGKDLFFMSEKKCQDEEDTLLYYSYAIEGSKESNFKYSDEDTKVDGDDDCALESGFDSLILDCVVEEQKNLNLELKVISTSDSSTQSDHFQTPQSSTDDHNDDEDGDHDDDGVDGVGGDGNSKSDSCASNHEENHDQKDVKCSSEEEEEEGLILVSVRNFYKPDKIEEPDDHNLVETSTAASTSKSSCEWRSSAHFRDSETEGLFSSSSRRSSANWETYAIYRKYDEEMTFLDRVSTQKLRETESLRSIKYQPRSISERIVHKFNTKKNNISLRSRWGSTGPNPYQQLEASYVAQVCLAWEALNWNYKNFQRTISDGKNREDLGCPARVAQQFQQFQVMLQRFIENEPYEYGRRPEVYARMRLSSPKLLQVPEFQGSDCVEGKEDFVSRVSSLQFMKIMEDVIRTFMNFLKGDKKKFCCLQVFKETFYKNRTTNVDPTLFNLIRRANQKKKARLKDLHRSRKCVRKRSKMSREDEMELLMAMIDMKIVSRVLRMPEINEEKLHWCEEKMTKVRFWEGRVQRDSSPLFFPAQY